MSEMNPDETKTGSPKRLTSLPINPPCKMIPSAPT